MLVVLDTGFSESCDAKTVSPLQQSAGELEYDYDSDSDLDEEEEEGDCANGTCGSSEDASKTETGGTDQVHNCERAIDHWPVPGDHNTEPGV